MISVYQLQVGQFIFLLNNHKLTPPFLPRSPAFFFFSNPLLLFFLTDSQLSLNTENTTLTGLFSSLLFYYYYFVFTSVLIKSTQDNLLDSLTSAGQCTNLIIPDNPHLKVQPGQPHGEKDIVYMIVIGVVLGSCWNMGGIYVHHNLTKNGR
jgi:hypothetical protein